MSASGAAQARLPRVRQNVSSPPILCMYFPVSKGAAVRGQAQSLISSYAVDMLSVPGELNRNNRREGRKSV